MSPMASEPARMSLLAEGVRSDALVVSQQALRLRDAAEALRGGPCTPDWLEGAIQELVDRCMVAAADLEVSADRLDEHAGALLGKDLPS